MDILELPMGKEVDLVLLMDKDLEQEQQMGKALD